MFANENLDLQKPVELIDEIRESFERGFDGVWFFHVDSRAAEQIKWELRTPTFEEAEVIF